MKRLAAILTCLVIAGCATHGIHDRIPERYTSLSGSASAESYLIEIRAPSANATAQRYEFTMEGDNVTARISTLSYSGARSEVRRSGETASRLLKLLRGFDWSAIEIPPADETPTGDLPDDTEVVFKARTAKSYREAQVHLADCAALRKLITAIKNVK